MQQKLRWRMLSVAFGAAAVVVAKGRVCALHLGSDPVALRAKMEHLYPGTVYAADALLAEACRQLSEYFSCRRQRFDLPLITPGASPFARAVLVALAQVPYGITVSYGELALRAGHPRAARAVGRVMATNPLPLLLPCHRVVGQRGALTGYSGVGGVETKAWLLAFERANLHQPR